MIVEHSSRSLNESNLINPKNFRLPTLIPAIISLVSRLLPLTISHHVDKSTWNYQPIDNNWYETRRYHVCLQYWWLSDFNGFACVIVFFSPCLTLVYLHLQRMSLVSVVQWISPICSLKQSGLWKETNLQLVHWNVLHFCRHSINSTLVAHWTIARQNVHRTAETSEILVSWEFSRIFFHFLFSFSISSRFNFTFTRKRTKGFYFSLFTSRQKWKLSVFHFFFMRKKSEIRCGV